MTNDFREQMDKIQAKLRAKNGPRSPIRVSRGHMGDLEAASLNCGNPDIQERFEKMKNDPGFEIVDDSKPGEFLQDLSIMFMYPNEVSVLDITKENAGMVDTRCEACRNKVKDWNGDDAKCGFTNGFFDGGNNWRCETTRQIRELVERFGGLLPGVSYTMVNDQNYATIPVGDIDEFRNDEYATPICLWVGWYKSRGRTEGMWLMYENTPPRPPTEQECLLIIRKYQKHLGKKEVNTD